ncbi:MAG TPA: aminotransferase class V-fold PLP-dependent enzyme [Puia sp.]|uniref:aminotransferase class V-fold PLP-dependent enzyme n=1 Tax=Puia sp. TaxID=2045100 RepID=UPI002C5D0CAA|nr:aminotransferase class V-fold PLP-dependent enzyme [Puia sp.]HVU94034.1 aminotransferase class V-fold PLP-dependent enzyme [Puia sp.]
MQALESYFSPFRRNILGQDQCIDTNHGSKPLVYADWTAAGRAYMPIEQYLQSDILPLFANTHTETTHTAKATTKAYEAAKRTIKTHVNANENDALLFCGSGATAAVNKLQRILGLRFPERLTQYAGPITIREAGRPIVFVTHMEHHSNHISWLETIATVETIRPGEDGTPDLNHLQHLLGKYKARHTKIAAITACSNVTGIETPYHEIAKTMHEHKGLCFVDFAASAPYVAIDMHPSKTGAHLDAIYFSGHKFLGGPGTPGILIFNKELYQNTVPDHPGGGTILYSNPWQEHDYFADIETREDGGTPPILQAIKAAACIRLKEEMGIQNIRARENEMLETLFPRLAALPGITLLEPKNQDRLAILSFCVKDTHHDTVVKHLNDHHGIQTRGGCSCAGPYGHYLLHIDLDRSHAIRQRLEAGDTNSKPGWVRLSLHPTMTTAELGHIADAIESLALLR